MSTSSETDDASARKTLQGSLRSVAQALARASLETLAGAISKDETTLCKIRGGDAKVSIEDAVRVLDAAGLKVVPINKVCVDRETYLAVSTIATRAMALPDVARRLMLNGEDE